MKRAVMAGLLAAGIAAQFGVVASMIARRELTLRRGEAYRFRTAPVDPYDAFRGRYVALRLHDAEQVTEVRFNRNQRVFARIGKDAEGLAVIEQVAERAAPEGVWLRTRVSHCWEERREQKDGTNRLNVMTGKYRTRLDLPFDRYYMAEKLAPEAENAYRAASAAGKTNAVAVVRIWRGFPVLAGVEIEGQRIEEVARQRMEK